MRADIEVRPALGLGPGPITADELDTLGRVVRAIGDTEFVPKPLRGRPGAILAAILYGRALGLDGMVALREVAVIDGTPSLSATAVLGRIRAAGHSVQIEEAAEHCIAHGRRADTGDEHEVIWTLADAERAGLLGKENWKRYPRAMLRSRAVTELARGLFSDAFAGLSVYTPEEMGEAGLAGDLGGAELTAAPGIPESPASPEAPAEAAPERTELERERGHTFAVLRRLDADPNFLPPEGAPSWEAWSKFLAAREWGVRSRSELTPAEWVALRNLIIEKAGEGAPFS